MTSNAESEKNMEVKQGQLEVRLDNLEEKINQIYKAIYGNGKEGLIERNTRADEKFERMRCDILELNTMIKALSVSIGELSKSIETHHNDKSIHTPEGLFFRKDVITIALLALIVIHSLLPTGINLWSLISKYFGL